MNYDVITPGGRYFLEGGSQTYHARVSSELKTTSDKVHSVYSRERG